jgi:hypothetical protein
MTGDTDERERKALRVIAALTVASGAVQVIGPSVLLEPLSVESSPATRHLFGTVGMFMVIVGALLGGATRRGREEPSVLFWAAAQKLGSAGAMTLGVKRSVFSPLALLVASFDFLSGVLALRYWRRLRRG